MYRFRTVFVVVVLLAFGPAFTESPTTAAPRLKEAAEEKIAGTWRQTFSGYEAQDNTKTEANVKNHWVITTETISIHTIHGYSGRWTYKLDTSKSPATLDLTTTASNGKPITYPSIIKIEEKQITVCLQNYPVRGYPKDFNPLAGSGIGKFIYVRAQAGDELKIVLPKPKATNADQ